MPTTDDLRDLVDVASGDGEHRGLRLSHVVVLELRLDLCADAAHVTSIRTRFGWLHEKREHGRTVSEFVDGLALREDRTGQHHAILAPIHVFRGHVRGEDIPVGGHDQPFGQNLGRKISVTCVRGDK